MTLKLDSNTQSLGDQKPLRIYTAEGIGYQARNIPEYVPVFANGIPINTEKIWHLPTDLSPIAFSLTESSVQNNKSLTWKLFNKSDTQVWVADFAFSDLISLGGLQYYITPPIILPADFKLTFESNVSLNSVTLLCERCHLLEGIASET